MSSISHSISSISRRYASLIAAANSHMRTSSRFDRSDRRMASEW
jgi:hypothetical protein